MPGPRRIERAWSATPSTTWSYAFDTRILERYAEHTARHGGPAAALSATGRVLASTPPAWTNGRIGLPDGGGELTLADGTEAVAHPLDEGVLLVPAGATRRPRPPPPFRLLALGRDRATLAKPAGPRRLTARHSEIAVLLALHAEGLTSRELAQLLYGEPGHEVTVRAELHRLRGVLGPALAARPYRLNDVGVDFAEVQALRDDGREAEAARRYSGPLLPRSQVPAIAEARRRLEGMFSPPRP